MDWRTLLFAFRGRINRAKYWLAILIYTIVWVVFGIVGAILAGGSAVVPLNASTNSGAIVLVGLLFFIPLVLGVWSGLAIAIKRLHDRNKSGWWLLLFWLAPSALNAIGQTFASDKAAVIGLIALIGVAIAIWGFVEIACLKGTTGPNDYGSDPLEAS
jgi:uncharacterized membrane protein YhaH (DUF805 family)